MFQSHDEFQITLPSNACASTYPDNKPQSFKTNLSTPLVLSGDWEVALMEISYPVNWHNLVDVEFVDFIEQRTDELGGDKGPHYTAPHHKEAGSDTPYKSSNLIRAILYPQYAEGKHLVEKIKTEIIESYLQYYRPKPASATEFPLTLQFDKEGQTVKFDGPKGWSMEMGVNKRVPKILGIELPIKRGENFAVWAQLPITSTQPLYTDTITSIYAYTDIIQPQLVGDAFVPLLGVVPVLAKHGAQAHWSSNPPYYLPLARSYINTIEIHLKDDTGEFVKFSHGKVVLRLHFRKRG